MTRRYLNPDYVSMPRSNVEFLISIFGEGTPVWTANFRGDPSNNWKDGKFLVLPKVHAKDQDKSNTYFCISTFDVGEQKYRARRNDLFNSMHVIVIDDVGTKGQPLDVIKRSLEPTYVIETSPDNFQVGYVLREPCLEISKATNVINTMNHEQGDKGSKGVNRVVRLPYGINCKPEHDNFEVNIKEWGGCKYTVDELIKAFNINVVKFPNKFSGNGRGNENVTNDDIYKSWSEADIEGMLSFISPDDLGYEDWLKIIQAIHSEHPTAEGLSLADIWSRAGSRYKEGEVNKRWRGFSELGNNSGRISIGTILYHARKCGWKPKDTQQDKSLIDELVSQYYWCIGQEKFIDTHKNGIMLTAIGLRRTKQSRIDKADDRILSHKNHIQVINPTFVPAGNSVVTVDGDDYCNSWKPSNIKPIQGDVSPFLEIMEHVYPNLEIRKIMIWFMAFTVVRPEIKIRWVPLIISRAEGIGKTLVFEKLIAQLVGLQFSRSVGEDELFGNFNGFASNTKLMMIEEVWVPGLEGRKLVNKLKPIQSNDLLRVNEKNLRPYDIQNYINMVIFSNHIDAAAVSKHSRRYFIYISPAVTMDAVKDGWGNEFKKWLNKDGLENVLWYFQNEVNLDAFEAGGNAPHTADKELVASMAEDDFASILKERLFMEVEPFENCCGFVSLEDVKYLWRQNGHGNRSQGYFDDIMYGLGWVYVKGVMKKVAGKSQRWPVGWCAMPEIKMLKSADQYKLLIAMSKGEVDLSEPVDEQPEWVVALLGAAGAFPVTSEVTP